MFLALTSLAALCFLLHVSLLVASFPSGKFVRSRYLWSHITLWMTGTIVFVLALLFSGRGQSGAVDYFNTPAKKVMILAATVLLSVAAHSIVKRFVLKYR